MLAKKYNKNVDVDAIVKKNLPISERYGVRQFIKKAEEVKFISSEQCELERQVKAVYNV